MAKKNHMMTPEERMQHDFAVKVRKMTDKQLYEFVHEPASSTPTPSQIVKDFIDLCATKGRRMGPSTICGMKMVAREAGYDIGL